MVQLSLEKFWRDNNGRMFNLSGMNFQREPQYRAMLLPLKNSNFPHFPFCITQIRAIIDQHIFSQVMPKQQKK